MKDEHKKSLLNTGVAAGALTGVNLGHASAGKLLGYERVHHGTTSKENVASIKRQGLRKSRAGTGMGAIDMDLGHATAKDLKGRVFTTTNKHYASGYTRSGPFSGPDLKKVVSARVPYRTADRLKKDNIIERMRTGEILPPGVSKKKAAAIANRIQKQTRIYGHSINPRFIDKGPAGLGNIKQFASKGNMRRYLSTAAGKKRFAGGIASVLGSAASLTAGGMALKKRLEMQKKASDNAKAGVAAAGAGAAGYGAYRSGKKVGEAIDMVRKMEHHGFNNPNAKGRKMIAMAKKFGRRNVYAAGALGLTSTGLAGLAAHYIGKKRDR